MTRKEPVAKNAEALKRTDGATPQRAIVIGLSPKLALEKEHPQRELREAKSKSCRLLRACPHLSQAKAQTKCRPARKLRAVFS